MGLFDLLRRLFGARTPVRPTVAPADVSPAASNRIPPSPAPTTPETVVPSATAPAERPASQTGDGRAAAATVAALDRQGEPPARRPVHLEPLRYQPNLVPTDPEREAVDERPYRFAQTNPRDGRRLDLSSDHDPRWLQYYGLPELRTPDDLAGWLNVKIGQLAWLTHRTVPGGRPQTLQDAHYVFMVKKKRSGGARLLESPKPLLKAVQQKILREILDHVPAHPCAHGFVAGRSLLTNAAPHVGQRFLFQLDLRNFYPSVRYARVVAIFRSLGFSREVAIWLARLTTTAWPVQATLPRELGDTRLYDVRHLPQGAPTSPALANLSAYALDVRLSGLADAYQLRYTRYADDLTLSGPGLVAPALREIIPLVEAIVRDERFQIHAGKRRLIRNNARQTVTGVVVNQKPNYPRPRFDTLKAILHNCVQHGPASQNREGHPAFAAHLLGRVAHVRMLNEDRGAKLLRLYQQIDWAR